jgi:hypothetical protein
VQNHIVTSHEEKLQAAFEFYTKLLGRAIDRNFILDLEEVGLLQHDLSSLEEPFSEEEVWSTICDFPPDNAPRTDVFIGRFNCASWGNIKEDMSLALDAVHHS